MTVRTVLVLVVMVTMAAGDMCGRHRGESTG